MFRYYTFRKKAYLSAAVALARNWRAASCVKTFKGESICAHHDYQFTSYSIIGIAAHLNVHLITHLLQLRLGARNDLPVFTLHLPSAGSIPLNLAIYDDHVAILVLLESLRTSVLDFEPDFCLTSEE